MVEIAAPGASLDSTRSGLDPAPVAVFDDFLPPERAEAMRADIDAHFAKPFTHGADTHQIWNYWFVPGIYTYLRTAPEKIFTGSHAPDFMATLQLWSLENLGLGVVTPPHLSLYVPGCKQAWHNDCGNGRFAYVYSLTRNERLTTGGETLVMREGDGLRRNLKQPSAGRDFYEKVAPKFNRLVIFDDRIPHAVERVDGVMDPLEGRFVLHGHIWEGGTAVRGALPLATVEQAIAAEMQAFIAGAGERLARLHGPLTLRLTVAATGEVSSCDLLIDRVVQPEPGDLDWEPLREQLLQRLEAMRFPPAAGETAVILPVLFGPRPAGIG